MGQPSGLKSWKKGGVPKLLAGGSDTSHADRAGALRQRGDERLRDRLVHVDALDGRADLARIGERA
jgi:hypothetical protein